MVKLTCKDSQIEGEKVAVYRVEDNELPTLIAENLDTGEKVEFDRAMGNRYMSRKKEGIYPYTVTQNGRKITLEVNQSTNPVTVERDGEKVVEIHKDTYTLNSGDKVKVAGKLLFQVN